MLGQSSGMMPDWGVDDEPFWGLIGGLDLSETSDLLI
jgi:hypothetical protein